MANDDYQKASRLGMKENRDMEGRGEKPGLMILPGAPEKLAQRQESLGIVEIPAELIVGTCTALRAEAFSASFYPAVGANTEFAEKWTNLCNIHLDEGIRDPIKAVEYLNRYYVIEGHKRVSVLKYFGAVSIPGVVTRLIPYPSEDPEVIAYQEFLNFYHITGIFFLVFRQPGQYAKLLKLMDRDPKEEWSVELTYQFRSFYYLFRESYLRRFGNETQVSQAFLTYIEIFGYQASVHKPIRQLTDDLGKIRQEIENQVGQVESTVVLEDHTKPVVRSPIPGPFWRVPTKVQVAFIHEGSAQLSQWTYNHEYGRIRLERAMGDLVSTTSYESCDTEEKIVQAVENGVNKGVGVFFTTHPRLLLPSVKQAVLRPNIKVMNCSVSTSYPSVRTYFPRLYGATFVMGAIAGAMSQDGRIGYVADYPTCGGIACINAFAQGARMVNANARIYLEWSKLKSGDGLFRLMDRGLTMIYYQDRLREYDHPGTVEGHNLALIQCYWGKMYQRLVRRMLDKSWKQEKGGSSAVNYWWGMTQGVVGVMYSRRVPAGTRRLVGILRDAMHTQKLNAFYGTIYDQCGNVVHDDEIPMSAQQILKMNWLSSYVEGQIPDLEEFLPEAQEFLSLQGVERYGEAP